MHVVSPGRAGGRLAGSAESGDMTPPPWSVGNRAVRTLGAAPRRRDRSTAWPRERSRQRSATIVAAGGPTDDHDRVAGHTTQDHLGRLPATHRPRLIFPSELES